MWLWFSQWRQWLVSAYVYVAAMLHINTFPHTVSSCYILPFVVWFTLIWSAHTVSLVRCGCAHRSFCQFRRTTWTLLLVVSLLLLQDSGTRFLWTVELLHLLTHLRLGLRHFSLLRHEPHCSTRLCTMARYKCIDWLIDWKSAAVWLWELAVVICYHL